MRHSSATIARKMPSTIFHPLVLGASSTWSAHHTQTLPWHRVHNFTYEPTTNAKCNMKNMEPQPMANKSSACWDGRPFGHNRHGPKVGRGCCGGLGPHLTQSGLSRGLPLYQVASWSIQPFGHNCRNVTLLHVGIRLRTIYIPSLVVKIFKGCMHWVIARYKSSK